MKKFKLFLATLICAAIGLSGCGVAWDMAADNDWRWGFFGKLDFASPLTLKVAVAPFEDEVGLGASEAGANLAVLMSQELAKDKRLIVIPPNEVEQAMRANNFSLPLSAAESAIVGQQLNANAIVLGSLTEMKQYQL
ncbi:MAG: hypothetical protein ACRCTY_03915, partial [Candidatus Adiutrix sp.]